MKKIAIIIVNWNGEKLLKDCLESLREQTYQAFKIIFVDNGSTDGSVEFVASNFPEIEIIKLEKNTGFAYANNAGIKKAFQDENIKYIITLNNDTKADNRYVEEMAKCAEKHGTASIQPKVVNFYEQDVIDSVGILIYKDMSAINRGQKEKDTGQFEKEEEIFGPSASAALYSREALEKTKLPGDNYFDDDYFAYYEDVDLAWRLRLSGFKSFYCPSAKVFHVHSATGKSYSPFKSFHIHRNQYYNIIKNLPFGLMITALLFMPMRYFLLMISVLRKKGPAAKLSENKKDNILKIIFKSWWQIGANVPVLIKKRRFIQKERVATKKDITGWQQKYSASLEKMIFG